MSLERILAEHGETLQYLVYFGLQDGRASPPGWLLGLPFRHRTERLQEGA